MKIQAIIHAAEEGGLWAEVPALPGCVTQGETLAEIKRNLKEAIALWMEAGQEIHRPRPEDRVLELAV